MNGVKQTDISIRQPDKTMYSKSRKLFDETQDDMLFRRQPT